MTISQSAGSAPGRQGISLVIAVYNEEDNLRPLVEEIVEIGLPEQVDLELIFVDDHSTDSGPRIMRELAAQYPFIKIFRLARNSGKTAGWAIGFERATREIVVTMDADLQNDPRDIMPMLQKLNEGYDLVSGQRRKRADTLSRKIQSRIANHFRKAMLGDNALDCGCGLKMIRRDALRRIYMWKGAHRFLEALAQIHGYRFAHILVNDRKRMYGVAKYGFRNRAIGPLIDLFGVRWIRSRLINVQHSQVTSEGKDGSDARQSS